MFFVCHLEYMQIWTGWILFFRSEKLKKCTSNFYHHDFPNIMSILKVRASKYLAQFVRYKACIKVNYGRPVSGILKFILADNLPFWILSSWKFSEHIPTWNRTFCFVVMVLLSGTVCQISGILKWSVGRPIKQVKCQKPQKAHQHPLRDVCVRRTSEVTPIKTLRSPWFIHK